MSGFVFGESEHFRSVCVLAIPSWDVIHWLSNQTIHNRHTQSQPHKTYARLTMKSLSRHFFLYTQKQEDASLFLTFPKYTLMRHCLHFSSATHNPPCPPFLTSSSPFLSLSLEQIIHVYCPHCTRSKALVTGPEADVLSCGSLAWDLVGSLEGEEKLLEYYRSLW